MEKVAKYCSVCQEDFSEKYSFCPNCAATLSVYEMNSMDDEICEVSPPDKTNEYIPKIYDDGIYHIAIVEDKNSLMRNSLLLGAFVFIMFGTFSGVIISIFMNSLNVGTISNDSVIAYLNTQDPDAIDINQQPIAKRKKDERGGGGGGDEDPNPASKGRDAKMVENPLIAPSVKIVTLTDPELKLQPAVKGPNTPYKEDKTQPYGIKNSIYTIPSDGPGFDGGQGVGKRNGQGPGTGPGIGPGSNGGRDGGDKGGLGPSNSSDPNGKDDLIEAPPVRKITSAMNILVKPKAIYTDAARQHAVQGTVILRVTFLANGNIGNITTVGGLPDGLTEQAIAAARSIRFEPQKVNGVAQTVTRQIQYSFTLF